MISSILKALLFTGLVVLTITLLIAILYVSVWLVAGSAVVLLFLSIFHMLQAKRKL